MFTVTVGLDWSGNSSTRRPLGSRYSVMPSTSVTFTGAAGAVATGCVAGWAAVTAIENARQASRTILVPVFMSLPFPDLALHVVQICIELGDAGKDTTRRHGLHDLQHLAHCRLRIDQCHPATGGFNGLAGANEAADSGTAQVLQLAQIEYQACGNAFRQQARQFSIQLRRSMSVESAGQRDLRYVRIFHNDGQ